MADVQQLNPPDVEVAGIGVSTDAESASGNATLIPLAKRERTLRQGTAKGAVRNQAVNSGDDIFTTHGGGILSASTTPAIFRVQVALSAAAKFSLVKINNATTYTVALNGGTNLTADAVYAFDVLVLNGDTIDFEVDANVTVRFLEVVELGAGA